MELKYFKEEEFERCSPPCKMSDMDEELLMLLDELREKTGIPIVINSAYRSKKYDLKKGRSGNSAHTKGKAVDIRCNKSANYYKIIKVALELGINRIGLGNGFIHLDNDKTLPQNVIWHYY